MDKNNKPRISIAVRGDFCLEKTILDLFVDFVEWHSHTVAPDSAFGTDSAGNDHIDFGTHREFQHTLNPSAVEALHGAGVVAFGGHGEHECLCGQRAGFVNDSAGVGLRNLICDWPEEAYNVHEEFAEDSENSQKA